MICCGGRKLQCKGFFPFCCMKVHHANAVHRSKHSPGVHLSACSIYISALLKQASSQPCHVVVSKQWQKNSRAASKSQSISPGNFVTTHPGSLVVPTVPSLPWWSEHKLALSRFTSSL